MCDTFYLLIQEASRGDGVRGYIIRSYNAWESGKM